MTAADFHLPARPLSLLEFVRPFLLLAVLAFLAGFGGYLILGPPNVMGLTPATQTTAAVTAPTPASEITASAPAATGDWNAPKQI
ncbi:hypothetical protein [Phenylobacterium sp.]|uniref:hypothetical protein n=1 Tax=Phenylobacterium sp. TaxID=1871053 RepID=UPI002BDDF95A|nr:hypothetical protein [Phenylobacterium sp.]HLZ75234.1 hypothetical protein [Phenylobacterium sp.]